MVNPFTNHKGICWTVSTAYMFADKEKMEEAEFIMKDKDENCHYARIASGIVKLFYAGKKIRSDEEGEIEQLLLYQNLCPWYGLIST
jgi:hypothetical protein